MPPSDPSVFLQGMSTVSGVRALATQALQEAGKARDLASRRRIEDGYLDRLVAEPGATDLEKAVASACRESTRPKLYQPSACNAHRVALQALAAGVGGPTGAALAGVAHQALGGAYNVEDARHMSTGWLRAIEAHGTPSERLLAGTAREATAIKLYHSTSVNAQKKALQAIAGGLQGTDQQVLAKFGLDALGGGYNQDDQRHVAFKVLESLQSTVLGKAARAATTPRLYSSGCVAVQRKALQMLLSPPAPDPDVQLAMLGSEALSRAYNREDARTMGGAILNEFADAGHAPVAQALAGAARGTAARYLYHQTAASVMRLAFEQITKGTGQDSAEVATSRLALQAYAVAHDEKERRTLGDGFLTELAARTANASVKAMVRYAQTNAQGTDAEAVALQRDVFDAVIAGRLNLQVRAGAWSISLPILDGKADPATQRAALEESVAHNRGVISQARQAAQEALSRIPALQGELADLRARLQESQAALQGPQANLSSAWETARAIGGLTALAGAAGALATGAVLAGLGVGVVGAAVFAVSQVAASRRSTEHRRLQEEVWALNLEVATRTGSLGSERSKVSAAERVMARAEEAVQEADKTLQVFRMADAVQEPSAPGNLQVEEDEVWIGGIRIPRRSLDAPAAPEPPVERAPDGEAGTAPAGSTSSEAAVSALFR